MSTKKEHPLVTSALGLVLSYTSILAHIWTNCKAGGQDG